MLQRLILGNDEKQRGFRLLLLACCLLGVGLRVYNYAVHPASLWQDEAYWAVKALKTAAIDAQIRPLGFMLLTQLLLRLFGPAAEVYRLLPFLASLVAIGLSPYVALRLFRARWSVLLAVLLLAVSPIAIEMSSEFKHYGVEIGVYVGVLSAFLGYREHRTRGSLVLLLSLSWAAFFLSLTIIFLYPALFSLLAWDAWKRQSRSQLWATVGVAVLCVGTIATIYFTTWRGISAGKAEKKWGTWYDVFYLEKGLRTTHDSRLAWSTAKYFELGAVPGIGRESWQSARLESPRLEQLKSADLVLWGALHVAGLAWLARRRRFAELALLWSPLLLVTLFNLAGRWPAGAFRTNSFYVPFAIFIAVSAFEWLTRAPVCPRVFGPVLAGLTLMPTLYFRPNLVEKGLWAKPGAFTEALRLLPSAGKRGGRDRVPLIMDFESCRPWQYYAEHDGPFSETGSRLRARYQARCQRTGRKLRAELVRQVGKGRSVAVLLTDPRKFAFMEGVARDSCTTVKVQWVRGRTHLLLQCTAMK